MLQKPAVSELLKGNESYYSLIVAVAKRARDIASEAELSGEIIIEKPVQLAVEAFARGDYKLVESPDIGDEIE